MLDAIRDQYEIQRFKFLINNVLQLHLDHTNQNIIFCLRKCDKPACENQSQLWRVFRGCGHLFHIECLVPKISKCPPCEKSLLKSLDHLAKIPNEAVFDISNSDNAGKIYDTRHLTWRVKTMLLIYITE